MNSATFVVVDDRNTHFHTSIVTNHWEKYHSRKKNKVKRGTTGRFRTRSVCLACCQPFQENPTSKTSILKWSKHFWNGVLNSCFLEDKKQFLPLHHLGPKVLSNVSCFNSFSLLYTNQSYFLKAISQICTHIRSDQICWISGHKFRYLCEPEQDTTT